LSPPLWEIMNPNTAKPISGNFKTFEHLKDADGWMPPPEGGQCPVDDLTYLRHVAQNCMLDLPNLKVDQPHDRTMVMVCGGTTAKDFIEDIRRKKNDKNNYDIFCSNKTHDWLISESIVPDYFFMIDPKESKVNDVKTPHKDVKYLIAAQCTPKVFHSLKEHNVTRLFSFCNIGEKQLDYHLVNMLMPTEEITPLCGGSMAGLRAMTLADVLGYRKVEFYGFDSCFFNFSKEDGKPIYYSYDKDRHEDIMESKTEDGSIYLTTPVFASQARQYIKWKYRLAHIKFTIFGDSLTAKLEKEDECRSVRKTNLLITPEYRELLRKYHENQQEFGVSGQFYVKDTAFLAGQIAKSNNNSLTVLDYGCGKRRLAAAWPKITGVRMFGYDPAIDNINLPQPADLVICTDVLEHVEPECLENVLDELQRLTKKVIYLSICLTPAKKMLPDGRNAHISLYPADDVWIPQIKKRFQICEIGQNDNRLIIIANRGRS